MSRRLLVVGGGIGGLAAALVCGRAGWAVRVFERAAQFSEVGAGIQIGPNVTRLLQAWGLSGALAAVAAFPPRLQVRDAVSGRELGQLRLGATAQQRYGAPYATIHRADLQSLLLEALKHKSNAELHPGTELLDFSQNPRLAAAQTRAGARVDGEVLLGADGLWSTVRRWLLDDGAPQFTGHLAYRALLPQVHLPQHLRSQQITVWLGPGLHLVQYPVRRGELLNVVGIVNVAMVPEFRNGGHGGADVWDQTTDAGDLRSVLAGSCAPLLDLVAVVEQWRMWVLYDRPPMLGPEQHGKGRVALLGDAAHPMRPYLAQGAGMAIEDAAELGAALAGPGIDVAAALRRFAARRWRRNRRVQARAIRNGQIFHAHGLLRVGRDAALKVIGERLLDMPWLYRA